MSTLYNAYISGIQAERSHEAKATRDDFSLQFANRTFKLDELLKNPRESCFFANIFSRSHALRGNALSDALHHGTQSVPVWVTTGTVGTSNTIYSMFRWQHS